MKGVYIAASLGGIGTVGGASALYLYKGGSDSETFRSKFSGSLIRDDEDAIWNAIWNAKWDKLKVGTLSGDNKNLKLALSKKGDSNPEDGKKALKAGCKELYDIAFKDKKDKNFLDFRSYCSKNNKEKANLTTWIAQASTDGAWTTKWTNLKSHSGDIDGELKVIKNNSSIAGQDEARKKEIKDWCDKVSDELFESESVRYNNFLTYCKT